MPVAIKKMQIKKMTVKFQLTQVTAHADKDLGQKEQSSIACGSENIYKQF